jgi:hypothetical protein
MQDQSPSLNIMNSLFLPFAVAGALPFTGIFTLSAQDAANAPPMVFSTDPQITIHRVSALGSPVTIGFEDSGTGAAAYRLEMLPRFGSNLLWNEVEGAQATPVAGGGFQFTVSAGASSQVFFRVLGVLPAFTDTDQDGLDDAWEQRHFGSLAPLASGDPDTDGYTNLQEYRAGTDPKNALSQPPFPLVSFGQAQLTAKEGQTVKVPLILNKPWTGQLHFAVNGTAVSGEDFEAFPSTITVSGKSAELTLSLKDNIRLEPIKWLQIQVLETGNYGGGRVRAVTVQIEDNDEVWQGVFVSRMGRFGFGLALYTEGSGSSGRLLSGSGVLPAAPAGGFVLDLHRTSADGGTLDFDSGWLAIPADGILIPGVTHVRLEGNTRRDTTGGFAGTGILHMGTPNNPMITVTSDSLYLTATPVSFVAGQTRFAP